MAKAKYFNLEYSEEGELVGVRWQDGSSRFVSMQHIVRTLGFHDPAMCESKDSDFASIVICMVDIHGFIYCLDAYIEKVPLSRQIDQAFAMQKLWKMDKLCLEDNNFQGLIKQNYQIQQDTNTALRVTGITQVQNKQKRISSLEPLITNGQLLFNVDINPRLKTQLDLFPTTHDDGPDALHGAVEQLRKVVKYRL